MVLPARKDLTLSVDGELILFSAQEGRLLTFLLDAQKEAVSQQLNETSRSDTLETLIWGAPLPRGKVDLRNLVGRINARCNDLVIHSTFNPGGWYLTRLKDVKLSRKNLPERKRGRRSDSIKPTLTIQVSGYPHQSFHGREATLLRLMFSDKLRFRNTNQIMLALGLSPSQRRPADKLIIQLRKRIPDLFETGDYGRGWRLNPQVRMFVVWDGESTARVI